MIEIKVMVYGRWTSCTHMKQSYETSSVALSGDDGDEGAMMRAIELAYNMSTWNCHYKSPSV
jgi:hypothetical protein